MTLGARARTYALMHTHQRALTDKLLFSQSLLNWTNSTEWVRASGKGDFFA